MVRQIFNVFSWVVVGLLAWDCYYFGPYNSVAVNAGLTLAERITKASEGIPGLLRSGIDQAHKLLEKNDDVASASIFPFKYSGMPEPSKLSPDALWAIQLASRRTGISTDYLLTTAYIEANFDAHAKSPTSSAAGMYQFIDSTWLSLMAEHGHDYGWTGFAKQIACTSSGRCKYTGEDGKTKVLDLRYDSMTATFLSAELARKNKQDLEAALNRKVNDAELYMAHFFGSAGAIKLIQTMNSSSKASAAKIFPQAAAANARLFYGTRGRAYTCGEFYLNMKERWDASAQAIAISARDAKKYRSPEVEDASS